MSTPSHDAPPLKLHIAVYASTMMDIRTRLPAMALQSDAELAVTYAEPPITLPAAPIADPKVIVLQRPRATREVWAGMAAQAIAAGWVMVLEVDDHPKLMAEVRSKDPADIDWWSFGFCHGVQTSTAPLARLFEPHNPEVRIFPNAVFQLPAFPTESRGPRIFYGAVSRGAFATGIAASLGPVSARFPEAEYVVIGDRAVFDALPTSRKVFHDYVSYAKYLRLMASCDISLAPLEGLEGQECKSDAKFLDAAANGLVTIASPTVYADTITYGVDGWIAREQADWARLLCDSLADPEGRRAMARRAWEHVRDRRLFSYQIAARRDWYRSLWDRRHALTADIRARNPGMTVTFPV